MLIQSDLQAVKELLDQVVTEADDELIDAIRRNNAEHGSREQLLAQLDVLELVRERLHVRFERITSGNAGSRR